MNLITIYSSSQEPARPLGTTPSWLFLGNPYSGLDLIFILLDM